MLTLVGPDSSRLMEDLGAGALTAANVGYGRHQLLAFGERAPVMVSAHFWVSRWFVSRCFVVCLRHPMQHHGT